MSTKQQDAKQGTKGSEGKSKGEKKQGALARRLAAAREKYVWLDRVIRMQKHYGAVRGNHLAGAITYFGFLSLFPLLAIAFAVVGYIAGVYPEAQAHLTDWLTENLPAGLTGPGGLDLAAIGSNGQAQASAGIIGSVGLLYSGLGWLDATREALRQMWALAPQKSNVVLRKLKDVFMLVLLGSAVLVSLAVSSLATGLTDQVLQWVGLEGNAVAGVFVVILGIVLAIATTTLILVILFARLPGHRLPRTNVFTGALLGAVLIEILKQLATTLLAGITSNNALYGTFAVVVGLLIYINVASRILMYAAAWCVVGPVETVEESVAASGETLNAAEATAASEARQHGDDDDETPIGKHHSTTAGNVPMTTAGVDEDDASCRAGGLDADKGGVKDEQASPARRVSKGSVLSLAGVLALLVLRRKVRAAP